MSIRSHSLVLTLFAASTLVAPGLRAQQGGGNAGGVASTDFQGANVLSLGDNCQGIMNWIAALSGSRSCTGQGLSGFGSFDIGPGSLHVFAQAVATSGSAAFFTMQAQGQMLDPFTFTGIVPASAVFTVAEDWTQTTWGDLPDNVNSDGSNWFESSLQFGSSCANVSFLSPAAGTFQNTRSVTCTGLGAQETLNYDIYLSAGTKDCAFYYPNGCPESFLSSTTDASNTGTITGVQFLDAGGNDITSEVTYRTGSGIAYPPAVTTTPEPNTAALFGTGLVAFAGYGARRKRGWWT